MNLSQRISNTSALSPIAGGNKGGGIGPLTRMAIENYSPLLNAAMQETDDRKKRGAGRHPVPRIPYKAPKLSPAMKAAAKLGMNLARVNPYVRFGNMAFDLAYGNNPLAPWVQTQEERPAERDWSWVGSAGSVSLCCDLEGRKDAFKVIAANATPCQLQSLYCGLTGQVPTNQGEQGEIPPSFEGNRYLYMIWGAGTIATNRMSFREVWWIDRGPVGDREPLPEVIPVPEPQRAVVIPTPIGALSPLPPAVIEEYPPERRENPRRERILRRQPYRKPAKSWQLAPDVKTGPGPKTKPQWQKGPPRDDDHILRPPGRNEREKKKYVPLRQALGLLGKLYDAGSEAGDIIDVLWDEMKCKPPFRPGRHYDTTEKANFIYNNLNCLDLGGAVVGLVKNHLEDKYIYGKIYGPVGKYAPYGSMGPGHGGFMR